MLFIPVCSRVSSFVFSFGVSLSICCLPMSVHVFHVSFLVLGCRCFICCASLSVHVFHVSFLVLGFRFSYVVEIQFVLAVHLWLHDLVFLVCKIEVYVNTCVYSQIGMSGNLSTKHMNLVDKSAVFLNQIVGLCIYTYIQSMTLTH